MAESSQGVDAEKPCDVCGAVGFVEVLHICPKCNVSREHSYCMTSIWREAANAWICEDCNRVNETHSPKPVPSEHPDDRSLRAKLKHRPVCAKVKYISPEEVIGLGSGLIRKESESKPMSGSNPARSPIHMSKRTPQAQASLSCRLPQNLGRNSTFPCSPRPSLPNQMLSKDKKRPAAPPTPGKKVNKPIDRAPSGTSGKLHDPLAISSAPTYILEQMIGRTNNEAATKSLSIDAMASTIPVEKAETQINRESSNTSSSVRDIPVNCSGKKGHVVPAKRMKRLDELLDRISSVAPLTNHDVAIASSGRRGTPDPAIVKKVDELVDRQQLPTSSRMRDESVGTSGFLSSHSSPSRDMISQGTEQMDISLRFDRCLPNHPALHATWRGNFRVIGDAPGKFDDGLRAHPASKVHINAYEFSKKMPEVLQFEFRPRGNFWEDIFEGDIPDGLDIGLYFFPHAERARDKYILLVEHLEIHDYVLRCFLGEVELLITTSKHLHGDSQRINDEHFLWGFFHEPAAEVAFKSTENLENDEVVDMDTDMPGGEDIARDHCPRSSYCGQSTLAGHQSPISESCDVDMEVDMLGGHSVGKVDVIAPGPSKQKNLTDPPISQVKRESIEGAMPFIPRAISTRSLTQSVERVDAPVPSPSKQDNQHGQLLSKVKTECVEETVFTPRTAVAAAASNMKSMEMACKSISNSSSACKLPAPPGFQSASSPFCDLPAPPGFTSIIRSPSACNSPAPPGFKSFSSSPSGCNSSAPPGLTEADKVKNSERLNNAGIPAKKVMSPVIKSESVY